MPLILLLSLGFQPLSVALNSEEIVESMLTVLAASVGLLQLMHPSIGAGVLEHSDFFDDPYDRVFRSVPWILGVVYDGHQSPQTGTTVRDNCIDSVR